MSYCRFSSDNWKCDLYCYESAEGFTTHVAGRRRIGVDNLPPDPLDLICAVPLDQASLDKWQAAYRKHHEALEALPFEDIELPHAGETFDDPTLEAFKERVLMLRSLGYHVPDYVIKTIDEEIADQIGETDMDDQHHEGEKR